MVVGLVETEKRLNKYKIKKVVARIKLIGGGDNGGCRYPTSAPFSLHLILADIYLLPMCSNDFPQRCKQFSCLRNGKSYEGLMSLKDSL